MSNKQRGEKILTDDILNHYLRYKPLQVILSVAGVKDDTFKTVNKSINNIEREIKIGDMFLSKVNEEIKNGFKYGEYIGTMKKFNTCYNMSLTCEEIYNKLSLNYGKLI